MQKMSWHRAFISQCTHKFVCPLKFEFAFVCYTLGYGAELWHRHMRRQVTWPAQSLREIVLLAVDGKRPERSDAESTFAKISAHQSNITTVEGQTAGLTAAALRAARPATMPVTDKLTALKADRDATKKKLEALESELASSKFTLSVINIMCHNSGSTPDPHRDFKAALRAALIDPENALDRISRSTAPGEGSLSAPQTAASSSVTASPPKQGIVQPTAHPDTRVVEALWETNVSLRQAPANSQAFAAESLRNEQESDIDAQIQSLAENVKLLNEADVVLAAQAISFVNDDFRRKMKLSRFSPISVVDFCRNPAAANVQPEFWAAYLDRHRELHNSKVLDMLEYMTNAHLVRTKVASRCELFVALATAIKPETEDEVAALNALVDYAWRVHQSACAPNTRGLILSWLEANTSFGI